MKASITPGQVVDYLNRLVGLDGDAMTKLFESRSSVNWFFSNSPHAPALIDGEVSVIGLLNGFFCDSPKDEYGPIAVVHQVACPVCGKESEHGQFVGDRCIRCGGEFGLGHVVGFHLVETR